MIISRKRKFIFIHIYKNAGTSIKNALLPFATDKYQRFANRLLKRVGISYYDPHLYKTHIAAAELAKQMGMRTYQRYFSFAFVRNPWDWQVSHYTFVTSRPQHRQHALFAQFGSFENYLYWRCAGEIKYQKDFVYSQDGEFTC